MFVFHLEIQFYFLGYLHQNFACIFSVNKNKNPVLEKKLCNFKKKLDNFKLEVFNKCNNKSTNLGYKNIFISKTYNFMNKSVWLAWTLSFVMPSLFLAKLKCIYKILKLNKNNFKFLFFSLKKTKIVKVLVILYHAGWISCVHDLMKILVITIFVENNRCSKFLTKIHHFCTKVQCIYKT